MTKRYSAVACFDEPLERVVLIHKLQPEWQAGKANFPGGKVEALDGLPHWDDCEDPFDLSARRTRALKEELSQAYRRCAARELVEETGVDVEAAALKLFCVLKFSKPEPGECWFFCCVADVDKARTMEQERVFVGYYMDIVRNEANAWQSIAKIATPGPSISFDEIELSLPTMSNLPWLTAMARQTLRGSSAPPFTVVEAT